MVDRLHKLRLAHAQPLRVRVVETQDSLVGLAAQLGTPCKDLPQGLLGAVPHPVEIRPVDGLPPLDGQVLDHREAEGFFEVIQHQQSGARLASARRAAKPVHVLGLRACYAALQDKRDVRIVHASRRDVAGDHDALGGVPELGRGLLAGGLRLSRVDLHTLILEDAEGHQRIEDLCEELSMPGRRQEHHDLVARYLRLLRQDCHHRR
mmetsp:Transcript_72536/g.164605  ORF Transcript_72536/g.164605 Transcript_72536/m.164605 type:complete len:207 (-) Transcript_72536:1078-1698(-)